MAHENHGRAGDRAGVARCVRRFGKWRGSTWDQVSRAGEDRNGCGNHGICGFGNAAACREGDRRCSVGRIGVRFLRVALSADRRGSVRSRATVAQDVHGIGVLRPARGCDAGDLGHRYCAMGHHRQGRPSTGLQAAWGGIPGQGDGLCEHAVSFNAGRDGRREPLVSGAGIQGGENRERDVELVAAAREALGNGAELLIDTGWYVHRTAKEAIWMVKSLERFRPFLIEEPLSPEDYDGYAQLAGAVDTPIACGEQEATEWGFRMLIERGQVDVVQPDLSRCGGFTAVRKIVHLAELHNRLCIPHSWTSDLLTAASLHLNAFMRRAVFQEFNVTSGPLNRDLCHNPLRLEDGMLRVPQAPGLGVEVNEATIEKYRVA